MPARFRHRAAARLLRAGGVIAHPTEAVYGLACDPGDPAAVERVLALKRRPVAKGLILIADTHIRLRGWVADEALDDTAVQATWPGPMTWILPPGPLARPWVTGEHAGLAVRVTAHADAAALCRAFGGPLISTSANPSTAAPARTALAVRRYFGERLDGVLGGATGGRQRPSEIRTWPDGRVLRPG